MARQKSLSDFFCKTGSYVNMSHTDHKKYVKKQSSAGQKGKNSK